MMTIPMNRKKTDHPDYSIFSDNLEPITANIIKAKTMTKTNNLKQLPELTKEQRQLNRLHEFKDELHKRVTLLAKRHDEAEALLNCLKMDLNLARKTLYGVLYSIEVLNGNAELPPMFSGEGQTNH